MPNKKDKKPHARPDVPPECSAKYPFRPGSVVRSVAGHDKGELFLTLWLWDDDYFAVTDGRLRRAEAPKRKNGKHMRMVRADDPQAVELARVSKPSDNGAHNAAIRTLLAGYELPPSPSATPPSKREAMSGTDLSPS